MLFWPHIERVSDTVNSTNTNMLRTIDAKNGYITSEENKTILGRFRRSSNRPSAGFVSRRAHRKFKFVQEKGMDIPDGFLKHISIDVMRLINKHLGALHCEIRFEKLYNNLQDWLIHVASYIEEWGQTSFGEPATDVPSGLVKVTQMGANGWFTREVDGDYPALWRTKQTQPPRHCVIVYVTSEGVKKKTINKCCT
uniref:Uncharacterized protein n=1 Tax=Timema bartmani TaxID=61472 RepID=A0A7R9EPT9_9NEOP|nr:unnamed protein product [Timema bartmani]